MKPNQFNQGLQHIEQRTRRFMLGAAAVLLLALLLIAVKQDYLVRSTTIYFFANNAQGLSRGMAVKFIGFKVGSVKSVSMEPNATVRVRVSLDDEYLHLIGQDAKARLIKEALVGESVVEIIPGTQPVQAVKENSVLVFERGQDAATLAESLALQLEPILKDIREITGSIKNPEGDLQRTLRNLNQASGDMQVMVKQFTRLAVSGNQTLDSTSGKLNRALDSVNANLQVLDSTLPGLLQKADSSLDNVQAATADIKLMTTESAGELPVFIHNTNALVQDGQDMLDGAKRTWPFRNFFPKAEPELLPVDGYVTPTKP